MISVTYTFSQAEDNPYVAGVLDVEPLDLWQHRDDVRLIDVRQPEEFVGELGHIPGSELLVLTELPEFLPSFENDQTLVFICRSGARSAQAAAFARSLGFPSVYNLKGGMILWNELNLPTEP